MVATLAYIHSHSAEEIMAQMPENLVGNDKAAYLAALKNALPMYSTTGLMDPKGAEAVLAVYSMGSPEVANAKIDITQTYTNDYVNKARKAN
jgi:NitT/TauT family transport system substrate-binding protein